MRWKKGKLFSKNGTKGRWWYPNGNKKGKVWLKHPRKPSKFMTERRR